MRRLPIYFLVDISESMVGAPIGEVQQGMRTIVQNLRVDPYALETVFVSIIGFAGKAITLSPLTELYKFYPPQFPIGGGTSLGKGLEALMDDIDKSVQKTTKDLKGDWKPIIFLFTDGNPTDNYSAAFKRWNNKYRGHCNLVAISIGDNVNVLTLAQLTDDILLLKETDAESFSQFFKWITASIKSTSMSVGETNIDEVKLAPTAGINLEKVEVNSPTDNDYAEVDDNFVVLHGRCANTNNDYLVKYAKRYPTERRSDFWHNDGQYHLIGAYPIDKSSYKSLSSGKTPKINTTLLRGVPTCPCCGNQFGVVVCECGGISCAGSDGYAMCPWCGNGGQLGEMDPDGMNITRGLG
ncbi:MAG: VWA domain-containing protein [Muribaculaceae bacterium]|nr:VWA domain-containing protein [Muribaculaceae bacterium]